MLTSVIGLFARSHKSVMVTGSVAAKKTDRIIRRFSVKFRPAPCSWAKTIVCFDLCAHRSSFGDGRYKRLVGAVIGRAWISTTVALRRGLVGFVGSGGFSSSAVATTLMAA